MRSSMWPLQEALYKRFSGYEPLMERVTGVSDDAPKDQLAPYITLGENTVMDWGTKLNDGEEITVTLHCWSEYPGKKEAKEILSLMLEALSEPLSVEGGFHVDFARLDMAEVLDDPDGITKHGVLRVRFLISQ